MKPGWVRLVVGTYNTHLGLALLGDDGGDLGWLLRRHPHLALLALQEVPSRRHVVRALRRAGLRRQWRVLSPPRERRGHPHILVRRRRFDVLRVEAPWMPSRFARARTTAVLRDRRSGRYVGAANVHVDPLGLGFIRANRFARRVHEAQVATHAAWLRSWSWLDKKGLRTATLAALEAVLIALGDFNEQLGQAPQHDTTRLGRRTATQRMARAGLEPAHRLTHRGSREVRLDDVFVRDDEHVQVLNRRMVQTPSPDANHYAVIATLAIAVHPNRQEAA